MIGLDIETAPTDPSLEGYALQPWRVIKGTVKITAVSLVRSDGNSQLEVPGRHVLLTSATCTCSGLEDNCPVCDWGLGICERCGGAESELDQFGGTCQSPLKSLEIARDSGEAICTWNGVFDVAFLIADGQDVSGIKWLDTMLLWKWYSNSQRMEWIPAWSLADGAKRFLKDWPHLQKFLDLKATDNVAGDDDKYWELRCKMDSLVTVMIAEIIWDKLTPQQQRSAMITMQCIVPTANSWVNGVKLNFEIMDQMKPVVTEEMWLLELKLLVCNPICKNERDEPIYTPWTPSKILRSPKKMGVLLYDTWGLECTVWTAGLEKAEMVLATARTPEAREKATAKVLACRATSKAALTYLADHDDRILDVLRWRELNTQLTKFIESPQKARKYLGSDVMHPSPKLFSTYTGRMTYSSKTKKKFHTGVALHQWPRNKKLRELIHA